MVILRVLLIAFNVTIVTYLIYRLFIVLQEPIVPWKKTLVIVAGLLLLFSPFSMFFGIFLPSIQYFMIYPIALVLFLYLIREVK
ncbi:MAG: hypothetical protein MUE95_01350 [Cyclobacteriaceae bacterium]|jgi:hypothetical protein|nr:hypothetical protein [Cyclobacteriaceae bacterium]